MESDQLHVPALVSIPISVNGEGLSQVPQQQLFPFVALLSQSGIISHQLQWIEQGRRKQFYVCMIADSFVADKSLLFIYLFIYFRIVADTSPMELFLVLFTPYDVYYGHGEHSKMLRFFRIGNGFLMVRF